MCRPKPRAIDPRAPRCRSPVDPRGALAAIHAAPLRAAATAVEPKPRRPHPHASASACVITSASGSVVAASRPIDADGATTEARRDDLTVDARDAPQITPP